jgi:hypothetical protein
MANSLTGFGAQDFMHTYGSQRTEELEVAWIKSSDPTPIFNGDLVVTSSNVVASGGFGNYITNGSSIGTPTNLGWRGVFRGCEYWNNGAGRMQYSTFWPGQAAAGTTSAVGGDIKAFIVSDPSMWFRIRASSGAILASSHIGMEFPVTSSVGSSVTGNYTTGLSGLQLAASSPTATSSQGQAAPMPFKLVDFYSNRAPGNWMQLPFAGAAALSGFVDGCDNTTAGQVVIVAACDWEMKTG